MKLSIISESFTDSPIYKFTVQLRTEFPELAILHITEHDDVIRLSDIEVKPEYRGRGIGSAVINRIKKYANSVGKPIVLSAQPHKGKKTALEKFYRNLGFRKPGSKRRFDYPMHTHIWSK